VSILTNEAVLTYHCCLEVLAESTKAPQHMGPAWNCLSGYHPSYKHPPAPAPQPSQRLKSSPPPCPPSLISLFYFSLLFF
jgi:hypothetical protein